MGLVPKSKTGRGRKNIHYVTDNESITVESYKKSLEEKDWEKIQYRKGTKSPIETISWKALEAHHLAMKEIHLRELFNANTNRFEEFSIRLNDLLFDRCTCEYQAMLLFECRDGR